MGILETLGQSAHCLFFFSYGRSGSASTSFILIPSLINNIVSGVTLMQVGIPDVLPTSCVTLGKQLNISESQCLHLLNGVCIRFHQVRLHKKQLQISKSKGFFCTHVTCQAWVASYLFPSRTQAEGAAPSGTGHSHERGKRSRALVGIHNGP